MAGGFGHLGHPLQVLLAAPGRPERVEGAVGRDPVQPGADRRPSLERSAEALLMGRRSDEYFGTRSPSQSGEWLDSLNRLPKYVVSSTLQEPKWTNATVLAGEVVSEVSKLKQQLHGEIVVYGSRPLVRTLMEHDLVDELRLTVYPVALGAGERLFGETSDKRPLRLIHTKTVGNGLAHLTYERAREA